MPKVEKSYGSVTMDYVEQWLYDENGLIAHDPQWAERISIIEDLRSLGYNTPNFAERQRAGELLPMTPWKQRHRTARNSGSTDVKHQLPGETSFSQEVRSPDLVGETSYFIPSDEDMDDLAAEYRHLMKNEVQKAAADVYQQGHDTLTFIAEYHKLREMVLGLLKSYWRYLKTGKIPPWNIPGAWLEARYGWRPLLYDLVEISAVLNSDFWDKDVRYVSQKSGIKEEYSLPVDVQEIEVTSGVYKRYLHNDISISVRGSVIGEFSPPRWSFNPFLSGWELTTLSFVADWIIGIGQWIAAMSFLVVAQKYVAAGGLQIKWSKACYMQEFYPNPNYTGVFGKEATGTYIYTERVPQPVGRFPLLQVKLDELKYWDLLAILDQINTSNGRKALKRLRSS
jgi:hypothetical protein